jgi:hypothetical protein
MVGVLTGNFGAAFHVKKRGIESHETGDTDSEDFIYEKTDGRKNTI